jgi:hypothetical protein
MTRQMDLWIIVNKALEFEHCDSDGSDMKAVRFFNLTKSECIKISKQYEYVYEHVRDAIETTKFNDEIVTTFDNIQYTFGSDSSYGDFISYLVSRGREVCLRIIADPSSILPPRNCDYFEQSGECMTREGFLSYALDKYCEEKFNTSFNDLEDDIECSNVVEPLSDILKSDEKTDQIIEFYKTLESNKQKEIADAIKKINEKYVNIKYT